jgi:hypothetical protein
MLHMPVFRFRMFASLMFLTTLLLSEAGAQLVWNQKMQKYSAILPLTLEDDVYRVRAKPPEGVKPSDINCDIGITGTVLTDQRGTSAGEAGEKVVSGLMGHDRIDVQFSDRVFTGYHNLVGDRIIQKYDLDCGINVKYQNLKKVAQVEIRVGYVLPSGDIEGLTWSKLNRKLRQFDQNLDKCANCKRDIANLQSERNQLANTNVDNHVQEMRIKARMTGISTQIRRLDDFASREDEFRRDLAAFKSVNEYLKTKVNGCQVFVHFHYNGKTLPVDIDDLKRSHVRPLQVFEETKDPIKHPQAADSDQAAGE